MSGNQTGRVVDVSGEARNDHYVSSLTPISRLLAVDGSEGGDHDEGCVESDEGEVVDVVGEVEARRCERVGARAETESWCGFESWPNEEGRVEMCEGSRHVKEQLDLLNVRRSRVYLSAMRRCGEASGEAVYSCDLVEKFLAVLFRRFAEDLIRQACSDLYFEPGSSGVAANGDRRLKRQTAVVATNEKQGSLKRNASGKFLSVLVL